MTVYYTTSSGVVESQTSTPKLYSYGKTLYLNDLTMKNAGLESYNLIGEKIMSTILSEGQKEVELSNLNNGVYIYKLKFDNKEICRKFVIE